ncbi:hypothetical protein COV11_00720, partial [Candidatus Woesearchaeota archaeon CG10_big_fil_rev_8_21_14_0_10_30_7]
GSYSKHTWLKSDSDVDIFVKFNLKYAHEDLSELLKKILSSFKIVRIHGSRDYFHIKNKLTFEIVPVLNIKKASQAHNVTDFSPLHVAWVKKSKLSDEIMIAKKFLKANKVYGAESYIMGFSGHVVDILTIHYGSFLKFVKNVANWKTQTIIDPEKKYKGKNPLFILNTSKIQGPLIVIDPVQPDRNAAAVVSGEKYFELIRACKAFIKSPSKTFFEEQKKELKKGNLLILEITPLRGKRDVVGSKLLKIFNYFKKKLCEFELIDSDWGWNGKVKFYFVLKNQKLSNEFVRTGPLLEFKDHVENFKKIHKNTFIKNNRINATLKRKYSTLNLFVKNLLKKDYVLERVISIKIS